MDVNADSTVDAEAVPPGLARRLLTERGSALAPLPDEVTLVSAYLETRPDLARRLSREPADEPDGARAAADGADVTALRREILASAEVHHAVTVATAATTDLYDALATYLARPEDRAGPQRP